MLSGHLAIVLHAHLPYVRHPEHERHLEERWLFEALIECYLPLLGMLDRLARDEVPVALTLSLTPTLGDMLGDRLLRDRFDAHLTRVTALSRAELRRLPPGDMRTDAANFYAAHFLDVRETWERHGRDVVGALVLHQQAGRLDLLASAATHAFLPGLLPAPSAIAAQVRIGLQAFTAQTGLAPCGFWLPECGFDPALDPMLADAGVRFSVLEAHGLLHATPRPPLGTHAPIASPNGIAYFARDLASASQVWSRSVGYPADPEYREFYRDIGYDLDENDLLGEIGPFGARVSTGIKYHRVTAPHVDLADKGIWVPDLARQRARAHAVHFVESRMAHVVALCRARAKFGAAGSPPPIVVAPYDAELFGHWWFEGPWFLEDVFRALANTDVVAPVTLRGYLHQYPTMVSAMPAASTWGAAGHRSVWISEGNAHLWRHVHHASKKLAELVDSMDRDGATPTAEQLRGLDQATVELLLLQSSDWPFIVSMNTATDYAEARARAHGARLRALSDALARGEVDPALLDDLSARDDFLAGRGSIADALKKPREPK